MPETSDRAHLELVDEDLPPIDHDPGGTDVLLGTLIGGRYLLTGVLGRGGGGVVYEGMHEELQRPVAVKVLGAAYAGDVDASARFLREARTASLLGHPNIVHVYDLGRVPDGRPFLAMELLDGTSLGKLRDAPDLTSPRRVAQIMLQAASALDAVHAEGIVHRDVKPENFILVADADGAGHLKLVDFGIAAFADGDKRGARLTRQGLVVGTPDYMAPEACEGALPDRRADVYALAVVAFELLAGSPPFDAATELRVLTMKMTLEPPALSRIAGRPFPPSLDAVLAKGLARKPEHRYASTGAFAKDLAREIDTLGELPAARSLTREQRVSQTEAVEVLAEPPPRLPTSRGPRLAAAAIVVLLLVGGGVAVYRGATSGPPTVRASTASHVDARPTGASASASVQPAPALAPPPRPPSAPIATPITDRVAHRPEPHHAHATPVAAAVGSVGPQALAVAADPGAPTTRDDPGPDTQPADVDRARAESETRDGTRAMIGGLLPQAIDHFRAATNAWPRCAPAWRGLGLANERLGRAPEAVRAYRRYLQVSPSASDAESVRGRIASLGGS